MSPSDPADGREGAPGHRGSFPDDIPEDISVDIPEATSVDVPDDISGVDNWVEEGGPLEPADEADSVAQQLAERTADLQRLQAEYVNYKRRVERDRDLVKQNATYGALSSLLPVLDDIDRAREHGELEGGFKAVAESLERIVSGLGLTKFGESGEPFDPNVHEALAHGHSPDVTETVVEHLAQAGYRIGDRVVRAAKVTVLDPE